MAVELDIRIPPNARSGDIVDCIRDAIKVTFASESPNLDFSCEDWNTLSRLEIKLGTKAVVDATFYDFSFGGEEDGTWCVLSGNLLRSPCTIALMAVIAAAIALKYSTMIVDDNSLLGNPRFVDPMLVFNEIREGAYDSFESYASATFGDLF